MARYPWSVDRLSAVVVKCSDVRVVPAVSWKTSFELAARCLFFVRALSIVVWCPKKKTGLPGLRANDVVVAVDVESPPSATFTVKIDDFKHNDVFLLSRRWVSPV